MINMHFRRKKNGVETVKPKFSMDTLNDNVDNAKSCRWKRFILQFAANKNYPPEYFLTANRGDIYIIRGDKILIAFICLLLIQKKCIQKIIFLKKVCLGVGFQVKFQVYGKVESVRAESCISEHIM